MLVTRISHSHEFRTSTKYRLWWSISVWDLFDWFSRMAWCLKSHEAMMWWVYGVSAFCHENHITFWPSQLIDWSPPYSRTSNGSFNIWKFGEILSYVLPVKTHTSPSGLTLRTRPLKIIFRKYQACNKLKTLQIFEENSFLRFVCCVERKNQNFQNLQSSRLEA